MRGADELMNERQNSLYLYYYYYGRNLARRGWTVGGFSRALVT
jgi:hypothetical protein